MQRFMQGHRLWPADSTGRKHRRWHLYWLPGPSIDDVYTAYARAITDTPQIRGHLSVQPHDWRHATVGSIVDRPTWDIGQQQLDDLHGRLREEFAAVEPFAVEVGPVWVNDVSVLLDIRPDDRFVSLQEITERVIADVVGTNAPYDWRSAGRPHLSVAYGTGPQHEDAPNVSPGLVASTMRQVTDEIAESVVYQLHALDVSQVEDRSWFDWSVLDVLPIGTALPSSSQRTHRCGVTGQSLSAR